MLPARRQPTRSGISRSPKREWPRHRKFVRDHECCCAGVSHDPCEGAIEFAHVRSSANAGVAIKPADWFAVSLCSRHHHIQHDWGAETFQRYFGIDLWELAAEFARHSPDEKMRAVMKEAGIV